MATERRIASASRAVERALRQVPEALRTVARNVPVTMEDRTPQWLTEEGFPADVLGLFVGEPYHATGESLDPMPAQIFLFLDNIWDYAGGHPLDFQREVRKTYLHELGHYLGLDEDDLWKRGME